MENNKAGIEYIKIPCLKSIQVENYSLFRENWNYTLKSGMNLFLGANGVGKTTTTNLIIYGIVGYQPRLDNDYFRNREKQTTDIFNDENTKAPTLILCFSIGKHEFEIERNIFQDSIVRLVVDGETFLSEELDNLDEHYYGLLQEYIGISDLDDIAFLLQYFLIRVEEGNYLLWDNKGGDQAKLIRLLINNSGFEEEYKKIARQVKDIDSKLRRTQDNRAQWVKRRDALVGEREDTLKRKEGYKKEKNLETKLKIKEDSLTTLKQLHEKTLKQIESTKENLSRLNSDFHSISHEFEQTGESATLLENQLYKYIYSNDKILSAIHKLKYYNRCIFCDNIPKSNIKEVIVNSVEKNCECPVCNSTIEGGSQPNIDDVETINELEDLKRNNRDLGNRKTDLYKNIETNQKHLEELFRYENELSLQLNALAIDLYEVKLQVLNFSKNPEERVTGLDSQIQTLNNEILKFDDEIAPLKIKYDDALNKLKVKNKVQEEVLQNFEIELNEIFKKYASVYFKNDCKLVTTSKKPKDSNVYIESFVPELDGVKRWVESKVSTSQRIFLEYLFRISLLELYQNKSKNKGFLILETSEGAFDISNTKQLAKAFTTFGKNSIPFIIVSNFSKKDFLQEIALGMGSGKKNRILNFINFAHLTEVQADDLNEYKKIMKELGLE